MIDAKYGLIRCFDWDSKPTNNRRLRSCNILNISNQLCNMAYMAKKAANITALVAEAGSDLTPTERRIAEMILSEPTLLAFGTVSDLASRAETSRPSIVRFAKKLGFDGYPQLQQMVRSEVSRRLTRPSERIRQGASPSLSERETLDGAIDSVFEATAGKRLSRLIKPIAKARRVWVLSGETSLAGAHAFRSGLSMIRSDVELLDDRTLGRELSNTDKKDVAVVFDFFRYRRVVVNAARILAESGVKIVVVTDGPLSPLVELTDTWCEISIPAVGPFDSSVPVVAIAEVLVSGVAKELQGDATTRIDRIESLWEATDVFL